MTSAFPIGVFDSGVGGLTVLNAMRDLMPAEDYIYLGDRARLPYGNKSPATIVRYACRAVSKLLEMQPLKLLVAACNTVSAVALPHLRELRRDLPVLGVVEPGADAACAASVTGRIAVIATESTVRGQAYVRAVLQRRPDAQVRSAACPLFVPLVEDAWTEGPLVEGIAARYLDPLFADPNDAPDCLVLGCTHYPLLVGAIRAVIGPNPRIVDSAAATAAAARNLLKNARILRPESGPRGMVRFLTTDDPAGFARAGSLFPGEPIAEADVTLVDL